MSDLDYAMQKYMSYIVSYEHRPFCYRDFLHFEFDGIEYTMTHGTFRNKIYNLIHNGIVESSFYSFCKFYTLKGHNFGKPMTPNHTVVHNDPLYKLIQNLPFDKQSIHDIRLKLKVPNIWKVISNNPNFAMNKKSKDIPIPSWLKDDSIVRIIIHKTDTVSVIIGCSLHPIQLDINGIIHFFNLLVRVEEKLQNILDNSIGINYDTKINLIPEYKLWTVTMWHFGRDALVGITDDKFCITVETAQYILTRLYVKDFNKKRRIRIEKQEYPKKTVLDAIDEKLASFS